jgi:hypothetical protein
MKRHLLEVYRPVYIGSGDHLQNYPIAQQDQHKEDPQPHRNNHGRAYIHCTPFCLKFPLLSSPTTWYQLSASSTCILAMTAPGARRHYRVQRGRRRRLVAGCLADFGSGFGAVDITGVTSVTHSYSQRDYV